MNPEYPDLIHRWFDEVWNQKNVDAIDEVMSEDTIHHGLGPEPVVGVAAFKEFHKKFLAAFPDIHVTVEDVVTDGDKLAARTTVRATHTGDGLGFPGTNETVEFSGIGMCTFKDGKFYEIWNQYDFMTMNTQMGILSLNTK